MRGRFDKAVSSRWTSTAFDRAGGERRRRNGACPSLGARRHAPIHTSGSGRGSWPTKRRSLGSGPLQGDPDGTLPVRRAGRSGRMSSAGIRLGGRSPSSGGALGDGDSGSRLAVPRHGPTPRSRRRPPPESHMAAGGTSHGKAVPAIDWHGTGTCTARFSAPLTRRRIMRSSGCTEEVTRT